MPFFTLSLSIFCFFSLSFFASSHWKCSVAQLHRSKCTLWKFIANYWTNRRMFHFCSRASFSVVPLLKSFSYEFPALFGKFMQKHWVKKKEEKTHAKIKIWTHLRILHPFSLAWKWEHAYVLSYRDMHTISHTVSEIFYSQRWTWKQPEYFAKNESGRHSRERERERDPAAPKMDELYAI